MRDPKQSEPALDVALTPGEQTPEDQMPGDQTPGEPPSGDKTSGDQTSSEQPPSEQTPTEEIPTELGEASVAAGAPPVDQSTARRRLRAAVIGPRRTQFIVAAVACVVAVGVVWQVRSQGDDEMYRTARRADLIQLVDGLSEETRRLESELQELEQTKRELESGSDARRVARDQTQRRLDTLSVLAGTAPATGPGVRITITDPQLKLGAPVLLDAMGEMRDAGAEVMEFNDSVRVVASTWVVGTPGKLVVDGTPLPAVIVLEVIGDPHSLEEAARFRGGLVSEVTGPQVGGRIEVVQMPHVDIRSVRTPTERVYAQPAG